MLEGLRIIEFQGLGPGPFAGKWFTDHGAEVTLIARTGGDALPGMAGDSLLDRAKQRLTLDLKQDSDREAALELISDADGLIEGFRPGVMERLGLGPEICHARNPRLVYGRMTGWGQDGPLAQNAGHDLTYIARSGALWYAGQPREPPFPPPTLVGDIGGGAMYLVSGMLAGFWRAAREGRGCVVDAAIVDGSAHMMALLASIRLQGGFVTERGASLLDGPHWSRCYRCADGGFIAVQALEPKFYARFLDLLGLSEDPEFARQFDPRLWPSLTGRLSRLFAQHPRDHWSAIFDGTDACVAPVLSPEEAAQDPHIRARGIWAAEAPAPAPRFFDPT